MLAERRSLKRFLFFYLTSTLLLVGIGEYLYYLFAKNKIVEEEKYYIKNELRFYLSRNPNIPDLVKLRELKGKGILNVKIAVYKNNRYIYGDFRPEKIYFNNESWVQNGKVYFLLIIPKDWGKIYVLCSKSINKKALKRLEKELILFTLFSVVFISISAFFLGKIFLKPMRDAIRSMEDFLDDVTHEMNTPLSIILNNLEILEIKGVKNKESERIRLASLRLSKLFRDLVYVKFNKGKRKVLEELDLKGVIEDRIEIFSLFAESKSLKIEAELNELLVRMDKEDALRVVDNLLSNAIKYSPQNSAVKIVLNKNSQKDLIIENSGEIKNRENIVKKFYREDKKSGGLGLGLYIVDRICREYNLKFSIDNENSKVVIKISFVSISV